VPESSEPTPPSSQPTPAPTSRQLDAPDLDAIEADLDAVQVALGRLADGSYWTDEVTGAPIPAEVLDADPLVRRA
jgi:RNA polymerase-binding transcription factor DksA